MGASRCASTGGVPRATERLDVGRTPRELSARDVVRLPARDRGCSSIRSIGAITSTNRGTLAVGFVVLSCLTTAEVVRQGAFYRPDSFVVLVVAIGLVAVHLRDTDAQSRVAAAALAFAAVIHGRTDSFLPLGASMLGFLASFLVVRRVGVAGRAGAGLVMATIGGGAAAIGVAACAMRWYPLAMPSQNLWRLATTITYSDAAGLLLGLALLVGMGLEVRNPLVRFDVALCAAGLVATQSRGAVLAVLVGAVLVPIGAIRAARWPLLAGLAAGLLVVGTSSGNARQPVVAVAVAALLGVGVLARASASGTGPRIRRVLPGATLALAAVVVVALHTQIERRIELASTSDRVAEWHAALDQWRSSIWTGVGPDVVLHVKTAQGSYAYFAHDEYLQVAAGGGLVGELLLLAAAGSVAAATRRRDALSSCAAGALVAFAVAALFDFDWHLAALGLLGGWVAGLATTPVDAHVESRARPIGATP